MDNFKISRRDVSRLNGLRERAREIRRQGEVTRRNWNPKEDSWHFKVYAWWRSESGNWDPPRNWCVYARRILFRASFRALGIGLAYAIPVAVLAAAIFVIVYFGVTAWLVIGCVAALFAAAAYILASGAVAFQLIYLLNPPEHGHMRIDWLDEKPKTLTALATVLATPVLLIASVLGLVLVPISMVLVLLEEEFDVFSKTGRWLTEAHFPGPRYVAWLRPWHAFPASLLTLGLWFAPVRPITFGVLLAIVGLGLLGGIAFGLGWVIDLMRRNAGIKHAERNAQIKRERNLEILRIKFAILHPRYESDELKFQDWLRRYQGYFRTHWGLDALGVDRSLHLTDISIRYYGSRWELANVQQSTKAPNMVQRTLSGLADLFVFVWTYIVVNKWKTCPLVELPA